MGFIDDLFHSRHVWEVLSSEYGWDDRWLTKPTKMCICQYSVAGQVGTYAARFGAFGTFTPCPLLHTKIWSGYLYIYMPLTKKVTLLDTSKPQIQHGWGVNSCARGSRDSSFHPKILCSALFRSLNAIIMYTAGAAVFDARACS